MWKPLRFVPENADYEFMRFARPGFFASMALILASIIGLAVFGLNFGVDFRGGTLIEIRTQGPADLASLRSTIGSVGIGEFELQEFGAPTDVLIRFGTPAGGDEAQQQTIDKIKQALGPGVDYRRVEVVGPKVSSELTREGIIAVIVSVIAVLIYIWFRYEWQFAIGAVASLVHDVMLTIGLFVALRVEFNLSIIAAILTIVGYSLNDTIVVFDRIRENLRKYKQKPLDDLIDLSLNQTLPRTMMTSISVLIALLALYIFGGEVIRGFTFTMIWGVIVGTYSSIFIAGPLLIFLEASIGAKTDTKAPKPATP